MQKIQQFMFTKYCDLLNNLFDYKETEGIEC